MNESGEELAWGAMFYLPGYTVLTEYLGIDNRGTSATGHFVFFSILAVAFPLAFALLASSSLTLL